MFSFVVAYILDICVSLDNYSGYMKKLIITVIAIFFTLSSLAQEKFTTKRVLIEYPKIPAMVMRSEVRFEVHKDSLIMQYIDGLYYCALVDIGDATRITYITPQIKTDSITYVYQVSNIQIKIRNNVASKIEVDLRTGEIFKELYY